MVCFAEKFLRIGAPSPMLGSRHWLRAVGHIAGKFILHGWVTQIQIPQYRRRLPEIWRFCQSAECTGTCLEAISDRGTGRRHHSEPERSLYDSTHKPGSKSRSVFTGPTDLRWASGIFELFVRHCVPKPKNYSAVELPRGYSPSRESLRFGSPFARFAGNRGAVKGHRP